MLFGKKKKNDESVKKGEPVPIDFRISGYELMRLLLVATLFVMIIAWISVLLTSLLYFLSFASVVLLLINGYDLVQKKDYRYGKMMFVPIGGAMFFLALSLTSNPVLFVVFSYAGAIFSPILGYVVLRKEIEKSIEVREVFRYE